MYIDTYNLYDTAYFVHDNIETEDKLILISVDSVMVEGKKAKLIFIFEDLK